MIKHNHVWVCREGKFRYCVKCKRLEVYDVDEPPKKMVKDKEIIKLISKKQRKVKL